MTRSLTSLAAGSLMATMAQGALAATLTFNLGGNGGVDTSAPSQFQFTQGGVTLTTTAGYTADGGTTLVETIGSSGSRSGPYIAQWSPGLGVFNSCNDACSTSDSADDQHTVDNAPRYGQSSTQDPKADFIKFSFGGIEVRVRSVTLACLGCDLSRADWDISLRVGNNAWASRSNADAPINSGVATYLFEGVNALTYDSIFRLGARFGDTNDSFKVQSITVETRRVPVPATVLLFGASLLGMGVLRRARRPA